MKARTKNNVRRASTRKETEKQVERLEENKYGKC